MTYTGFSSDPVHDAARHYDAVAHESEAQGRAEELAADAFIAAARHCDANRLCAWAGLVTDWERTRGPILNSTTAVKRMQTMTEIVQEGLDYPNGPDISEVVQLLLNVAYGTDLVNQPRIARELMRRIAATWAEHNTDASAWGGL